MTTDYDTNGAARFEAMNEKPRDMSTYSMDELEEKVRAFEADERHAQSMLDDVDSGRIRITPKRKDQWRASIVRRMENAQRDADIFRWAMNNQDMLEKFRD